MSGQDGGRWPWEYAAMRDEELPEGLPLPDQMAFLAMRNLYAACRERRIPREQARDEKEKIGRTYDLCLEDMERLRALLEVIRHIYEDTAQARDRVMAAETPEERAESALWLCGVISGDAALPQESYDAWQEYFKAYGDERTGPYVRDGVGDGSFVKSGFKNCGGASTPQG